MTTAAKDHRMQAAIAFVVTNPGTSMRAVIHHVLSTFDEGKREKLTAYKQAAAVVERIVKDRHVYQRWDKGLCPWDAKRKAYADALERACMAAPTEKEKAVLAPMVLEAWRRAGDEGRARTLDRLFHPNEVPAPF